MASEPNSKRNDIAIIGMACRFPGADDHAAFWHNLEKGECAIQEVPPERWDAKRYYSPDPEAPNKSVSKWYGVIRGADRFDNRFFNIPPGEARYMDPQQRLLLEEAWHCIEDAGIPLSELRGKRTDVYVGTADWDYILNTLSADVNIHTVLGNHSSLLANRISYMLGLGGTSLTLDTACSSSLFAAEKACEALSSESAEYALVASACVHSHPLKYIAFSKAHIVSPDGRCKTFDRDADGFVLGDGVGVLLLQRLEDALREKKHIYGVIKGVATNHGGSGVTLTSPSTTAQADVLTAAYAKAGVTPDTVDYIEAHGTGTLIGDPIEIEALTKVFRQHTDERQFCSIGSVKTNIGHTGGSAGMAGIIKVLWMMQAGKIPPSLHFNTPNPVIDFEDSPFRVATELRPWKSGHPVYAGVSAFGFGGANAHVVLESPPQIPAPETTGNSGVFMLSAKSEESLLALLDNWKQFIVSESFTHIAVNDMCKTLATGRESFSWRCGCVAGNENELRRFLKAAPGTISEFESPKLCLRIGACDWQGWKDVAPLLSVNTSFEKELEDVSAVLGKFDKKGAKLRGLRRKTWTANHNLYRFVTGYAFLKSFLDTSGITPDLLAGDTQSHGKKRAATTPDGFITALALSGALSLDDALALLSGNVKPAGIVLSRPDISFFDPVARRVISPSHVTADDLKTLVKNISLSAEASAHYLAKAASMLGNQFTFTKYVKEWETVAREKGRSIRQIMGDEQRSESEARLFCVIVADSIRRLNRKWKLSEKPVDASQQFFELVDLITDGALPRAMAAALLQDESPDVDAAAEILNQNQRKAGNRTGFQVSGKKTLTEIEDVAGWLKALGNDLGSAEIYRPEDMLCFDFGRVTPATDSVAVDMNDTPDLMVEATLLKLWLKGVDITFQRLYPEGSFRKVPLPVYPFQGDSHWLSRTDDRPAMVPGEMKLHPLLHRNTSDLSEQRFSATFTGDEFFLADHLVKNRRVLPGVAHLEMAGWAVASAADISEGRPEQTGIKLKNVVWLRPIVSTDAPVHVNIGLFPLDNRSTDEIGFEIYEGVTDDAAQVFSQGTAAMMPVENVPMADIETLKARCNQTEISADGHYGGLKAAGLDLGISFRGIETLYAGEGCALARLVLPDAARSTMEGFSLHPGLLDSALQAASCLFSEAGAFELAIPFSVKTVEIYGDTTSSMWSFASKTDRAKTFDVELFDESGRLCVRVLDIAFRKPKFEASTAAHTMTLCPQWKEEAVDEAGAVQQYNRHLVLVCEPDGVSQKEISIHLEGAKVQVLFSKEETIDGRFRDFAIQTFMMIQDALRPASNGGQEAASGKTLIQLLVTGGEADPWVYGLAGMLKTANLENPGLVCQLIDVESPASHKDLLETIGDRLLENGAHPGDRVVRYLDGKRFVERMEEVETDPSGFTWPRDCVCLITGGLGGLGLMFSQEIAERVKHPTLILTGRSEPDADKLAEIDRLKKMGARVAYRQADVGIKNEVTALIHHIETTYGPLTGVIHSAGCIRDNFIIKKSVDECAQVMAPKVLGLVNLDAATQNHPLDFFVIFSSMAGSLGNIGQADYACANAFAGGYAAFRNRLVDNAERQGRTVSIHWPLWKEGGMTVGAETEEMMRRNMGMSPMETQAGIQGFYRCVAAGHPHIMVIEGDVPTIRRKLLAPVPGPRPTTGDGTADNALRDRIRSILVKEVSQMMGIPRNAVEGHVALETYGFDSISMTEFTNTLNGEYGIDLAPTVFFEYPDVNGLSDYLATAHQAAFSARLTETDPSQIADRTPAGNDTHPVDTHPAPARRRRRPRFGTFGGHQDAVAAAEPVAIVGISGRFPMAEDIGAFWENLANGKHCITEIPQDRWDWKALHTGGDDMQTPIKWGGFIDGVDEFDPSFFEISPREAELMEPQQRLMMGYAWKAIEDAGMPAESLAGTKTGLFVGTGGNQYAEILAKANIPVEGYTSTGSVPSIGPNRMSYFLDIHGPSEPVETSCSSSLIAIHRAVEAMANGSCEMAIVGGVNTIITPNFHLSFGNAGMLSPDGKCKTFSDRADGYVRGEGVGMLFLKKLSLAEQAGDHIYGVIRGTAVNHGGRSSSLTAPNPKAQKEVLVQAYRKAGIDPRTVGYIEAHGTGTNLGDPIEVEALKTAFKELYSDAGAPDAAKAHCGLGSVKSNIGHTELAAGVSGVIKVLLQMQHKTIAKSLHCDTLNPYIRLEGTPFYIARKAREWAAPTDAEGRILPRRAGVSSFGFGGANAHVIIEEYVDDTPLAHTGNQPSVFVLSAKNESRLRDYARVMADFLAGTDADPADIAYTVQTGRDAMDERLGLVVDSVEELREKLSRFADGNDTVDGLYHANARRNREAMTAFASDDELQEAVDKWVARGKYAKLVSFWVRGLAFDWHRLYGDVRPKRISLPTYPFAKDRYWIDTTWEATESSQPEYRTPSAEDGDMMLKPLWHEKKGDGEAGLPAYTKHLIALCGTPNAKTAEPLLQLVRTAFGDAEIINLEAGTRAKIIHKRFSHCALKLFETVQTVVQSKPKGKVLIQVVVADGHGEESRLFSGLSGILKTARLENPAIIGQVIEGGGANALEELLGENSRCPEDAHIRYCGGKRLISGFEEIPDGPETPGMVWKDGGVYLITGGAGGLGLIFAEDIAGKVNAPVLVLTGRSAPGTGIQQRLEALGNTGARVEFRQSDVTGKADVDKLIRGIIAEFGGLTGIIHSAGVIRDNFILNKTADEFETVLAPKVAGATCLDEASKDLDLDFFVMFSSGVGAVGNAGQADYACANAYMDAYAAYRGKLVKGGKRKGRTLSINWAPWKSGGMPIDALAEKMMARGSGIAAMETQTGIRAFHRAFALETSQVMPVSGDLTAIRHHLLGEKTVAGNRGRTSGNTRWDIAPERLAERTELMLKRLFAGITRVPFADIGPEEPFEGFGIDSFMIARLNEKLEETFAEVPKTLFYEYRTIRELACYFVSEYPAASMDWVGFAGEPAAPKQDGTGKIPALHTKAPARASVKYEAGKDEGPAREPIAIIGISGHYPLADTLDAFWENLRTGRDCIREIPPERWPLDGFFHPDPDMAAANGKSYCKWGGFMDGFADFDPLFFNISPKEAMDLDPQERLFLKACWEVFEDAGYTKDRLKQTCDGRVGVFAGITKTGYELYGPQLWQRGETAHPNTSFSSLANRVSYLFDLKGPSLPVDTMCSSSLTAIHEACEHLYRGECEMAVAGGVNLYLHPSTYVRLCSLRMLTTGNTNKSFGKGGDGFLPGEGGGAVLLKPLSQALADKDPIHALIRGTGINHGGKTSGYTIPSPMAQAELIGSVMDKAGVTAREISYVETHGTGTELGDPIEIAGLTRAFGSDGPFCAIGSAKSNIGHLEACAGIAGLTKIILQMEHGQIAPSLHARELNPNIDFDKTPFTVQQELGEWVRQKIDGKESPRMAGLSSFGAGGANAHIILEEFPGDSSHMDERTGVTSEGPLIFVLSARNENRLKAYAGRMQAWLEKWEKADPDTRPTLGDITYTLQTGREPMKVRMAMMADSAARINEKLSRYIAGQEGVEDVYQGSVKGDSDTTALFSADEDLQDAVGAWMVKGKYGRVLDFWVRGLDVDWDLLYAGSPAPKRISLPTYPFVEERYWPVEKYNLLSGNPGVFLPEFSSQIPADVSGPLLTFEEYLCGGSLPEDLPAVKRVNTLVCILENRDFQEAVVATLKRLSPDTRVRFLQSVTETAFAEMLQENGTVDAVWYMAALEDPEAITDYSGIVDCIKAMAAAGLGDIRFLMGAHLPEGPERCYPESWIGFERSLGLVMPRLQSGVVLEDMDAGDVSVEDISVWAERLWKETQAQRTESALYREGKRYVYRIRPAELPTQEADPKSLIKPGHTYVITGGCGGLGALFARHLAEKNPVNLILTGRSPMDEKKEGLLGEIKSINPEVRVAYIQADVCDAAAMAEKLGALGEDFSPISGVIHAAGIEGGTPITEKDMDGFNRTVRSKITGTLALDEVLKDVPLDFVCYFSSSAALLGDFGWCDYAVGNRFLAAYGDDKQRRGAGTIPLVVHWPLWKEGGMGFDSREGAETYLRSSGQRLLETDEALALFDRLLSGNGGQYLALAGEPARIHRFLGIAGSEQNQPADQAMAALPVAGCLEQDIKETVGNLLAIPADELDTDVNLAEFGFDSITLTEFGARLSDVYEVEVSPAIFFEINTIEKLVAFFMDEHPTAVSAVYGDSPGEGGDNTIPAAATPPGMPIGMRPGMMSQPQFSRVPLQETAGDMDAWLRRYPECVPLNTAGGVPLNGGSMKQPCFWIHPLTGSVEPYVKIARSMDAGQPFFGIRAKGFGTDRGFLSDISEMARYYIDIISGIDPHGPYQLAGFSMGGVIAQEMARQLQERGKDVGTLLLLEPPFPSKDTEKKRVNDIALDRETIVTTANFFLYAHVKKILGSDVFATEGGKRTGEALIDHLASSCVDVGVRQSPALIGHTIRNMCEAFAHNKIALASHTVSPLPNPEGIAVYYFTQSDETAVSTDNGRSSERLALHDGTRKLLGEKLTHDETHYRKWQALLPGMQTVRVPSTSHFDFLSDRDGLAATIETCRAIFRTSPDHTGGTRALSASGPMASVLGSTSPAQNAVAIVGMSGRFPRANDLDEFWQRLYEGRDCISEIPKDRWDWQAIYGDPLKSGNRTDVKWGGFMDGVGDFDPMFFGIAPKEAQWMDPMQRLLMLYTWKAVEDAGYAAQGLAGSNTGMFIGTGGSGYCNRLFTGGPDLEGYYGTGVLPAMGPNRMSYFMGLHGPSEPVDTTCSSSLVAICRAVEAIEAGTCDAAVAGGVNLIVDPAFHISLDRLGMLSKEGRCRTFSSRADGYVRGEGVGMLFLKSLRAAEADGDHIYAVIRGNAVNHGGKANSLTAPNPRAQVAVLTDAYEKAGIDPGTVGYIEAHGTGTVLGDPIEIDALKTAFRGLHRGYGSKSVRTAHCGLGSVKTNIGHLELAAGVAGVIKVLLQLKHKTIAKSLHCDTLNPHIKLEDSPFYIADASRAWDAPGADTPRRAGVSAFGAGGVNAHLVLEEYIHKNEHKTPGENRPTAPSVFVLSARDEERLKAYARTMADFLDAGLENGQLPALADIAYTSQVGRDAMEERLAIMTNSVSELRDKLSAFGREGRREEGVFRGNVKRNKETLTLFIEDEDFGALLGKWVRQGNYRKLLSLWAKGLEFDWNRVYGERRPRRVSLPTYPFAEDRYWIESDPASGRRVQKRIAREIHPLLHENTSDLSEQRFSSVFTGDESFLGDDGNFKVLSPSVQLEMARAAAIRSAEGVTNVVITDVTGFKPLAIEQNTLETHIGLFPEQGGELGFEIYIRTEDEADVYTSGRIVPDTEAPEANEPVIDLAGVKAECERHSIDALDGLVIKEGCLRELHPGKDVALARLTLPDELVETSYVFGLHPTMMDTALNVARALMDDTPGLQTLAFELERLELHSGCLADMWAVIRCDGATAHVDLCDETGAVLVRMQGFRGVDIEPAESVAPVQTDEPTTLATFEEVLREAEIGGESENNVKTLLCVLNGSDSRDQAAAVLEDLAPETNSAIITPDDDYKNVIAEIIREHNGPDAVLYLADGDTAPEVATDIRRLLQALAATDHSAPLRFLLAAQLPEGPAFCHGDAWVGFARSLPMVMPKLQFGVIIKEITGKNAENKDGSGDVFSTSRWVNTLWRELHAGKIESAVYRGDKRYVYQNREMDTETPEQIDGLIKSGKTYVITGGCGGLGGLLARYLAANYNINLVLTGRSPVNEKIQQLLNDLRSTNSFVNLAYVQADVCDAAALKKGIAEAGEEFRAVAGVIHGAGIESDGDILGKDSDAFNRVLRPKIEGCLALEEAFGEQPLDFICYYSSTSAVLGDFGSCDYAIANRFMAAFARYKTSVQSAVKHMAIHWPLWRDGGMGFDFDGGAEMYLKSSGQRLLETAEGVELFDRLIARDGSQHLVLAGVLRRLRRFMGLEKPEPVPEISVAPVKSGRRAKMKGLSLAQCLEADLKLQISSLLGIDANLLDADANLADFGFDSILFAKFAEVLTEFYATEITPSIFFGNPSIERLVHYFMEKHSGLMEGFYGESRPDAETYQSQPEAREQKLAKALVTPRRRTARFFTATPGEIVSDDIAVIGMSGRFPQARNIDEMWEILKGGQDAVTEIPMERFDWRRYYGPGSERLMVSNRCGIVPGVAEFDSAFFEISPKEAKGMDPRQRLLLQESWRALEDAGYGPAQIRKNRMGIFVGMESGGSGASEGGEKGITSDHEGVSAVRLAYFLNFHGPAMAINTSCSSGLVAAHQACQSLRTSECDTAIAAGVNLMLHPDTFVGLSKSGMMSPSGKCFAFDKRADGMVPGEAVVSLVLKRLSDAERDNDPVYAVIRGSAINYDGRTNGITAPNQDAQAELLKTVYDRYKIDPRDIAHIVTHGTGTKLGDAIEINALADVFKDYSGNEPFCALTSTKTNFGHCFAASGLVSLVSLVQAVRHGSIPRSLHFSEENDHITWKDSPFYVNPETKPWPAGNGGHRLGAVSAFGMSGTNAHMVVESHEGRSQIPEIQTDPAYLLVFSAKQETVLEDKIREMAAYLGNHEVTTADLAGICRTLSGGRHHFKYRSALVAQDVDDAVHVLNQILGCEKSPKIFRGAVPRGFTGQTAIRSYTDEMLVRATDSRNDGDAYRDILFGLAELYCQGYDIPLDRLFHPGATPGRRLPAYPFARDLHGVSKEKPASVGEQSKGIETAALVSTKQPEKKVKRSVTPVSGTPAVKASGISLTPLLEDRLLSDRKPEQPRPPITLSDTADFAAPRPEPATAAKPEDKPVQKVVLSMPAEIPEVTASQKDPEDSVPKDSVPDDSMIRTLKKSLAEALYMDEDDIDPNTPFTEMGMDSIIGVEWIKAVNDGLGTSVEAIKIYDYPTLREFEAFMAGQADVPQVSLPPLDTPAAMPATGPSKIVLDMPVSPGPGDTDVPENPDRTLDQTLHDKLTATLAQALYMDESDIDPDMPFTEMGMDSIIGVEWIKAVNDAFGISVEAIKIYDYPTLREFEAFMAGQADTPPVSLPPLDAPPIPKETGPSKIGLDVPDTPGTQDTDVVENPDRTLDQTLHDKLTATLAQALYMDESDIDPDMPFTEMGMDSIIGVEWIKAVNDAFGMSVEAIQIYDHPTLREFEGFISGQVGTESIGSRVSEAETLAVDQTPVPPATLEEILAQVQQGLLDVDQADKLLQALKND